MSFGVYEAGSSLVFQLLGVKDQAATLISMLGVHIWSQSIEYLVGGIFVLWFLLHNRRLQNPQANSCDGSRISESGRESKTSARTMLAIGAMVLFLGVFFLSYQLWATAKLGALNAPESGSIASDVNDWQTKSRTHVSKLDGFVVFSSNRDGNHDIFRRDLGTFKLDKLTNHPNTETYPRISPNGRRLLFSRSHQQWVSQRNTVAWDVYVLDLDTMEERIVGRNGTAPSWLNNKELSYLSDADTVKRVNVDTLSSSVLYRSGDNNMMPRGARLHNPKFNEQTKQLVFTARQSLIGSDTGHWGTAIDLGGKHLPVLNGCELAWNFDGTGLYQVSPDSADGSVHIVSVDPKTLVSENLINLEGDFTHEYWPKDSSNGEFMVFGASRGATQHEHDTQDYEIFLWRVGSQANTATRLTFHTGNDNWPDVHIR
jgi:hypothetical protein